MPGEAQVFRLPMSGPDDVSGIVSLISDGKLEPQQIIAILGKTEGNGCVNDFTRGYATQSLRAMLASYLGEAEIARIPLVMSGGTEGGLSPHWIVSAGSRGHGSSSRRPKPLLWRWPA
jgi:cyanuric acid amidohydrolase